VLIFSHIDLSPIIITRLKRHAKRSTLQDGRPRAGKNKVILDGLPKEELFQVLPLQHRVQKLIASAKIHILSKFFASVLK